MDPVVIRPATADDASELHRLNAAFNGPGPKTPEEIAGDLIAATAECTFVAQARAVLAGFCCCQVKQSWCYETVSVEITELYVEPAFRRQGIARRLLEQVEALGQLLPVENLQLLTGDDNTAARLFYESCGYRLSGEAHYEKAL